MNFTKVVPLIREVIEKNDVVMAEAIMDAIYPLLDAENKLDVDKQLQESGKNISAEMAELFMRKIGVSQEVAAAYLEARLMDPSLDRAGIEKYIECLGDKYGSVVVSCLMIGEVDLADKIASMNGYSKIDLSYVRTGYGLSYVADGHQINLWSESMLPVSPVQAKGLVNLADKLGLDDLIEFGNRNYVNLFRNISNSSVSTIPEKKLKEIPVVDDSMTMKNPELLIAFHRELESSALPLPYERIPCWVHVDVLSKIKTARVFDQERCYEIDSVNYPIGQLLEKNNEPGFWHGKTILQKHGKLRVGLKARFSDSELNTDNENNCIKSDIAAMSLMADSNTQHGFNFPACYKLVIADVRELSEVVSFSSINQSMLTDITKYASEFYPLKLFAEKSSYGKVDPYLGFNSFNSGELFSYLNTELRHEFLGMFSQEFFREAYSYYARIMTAKDLLIAYKEFGFDNTICRIKELEPEDIDYLFDGGFKINPDGETVKLDNSIGAMRNRFLPEHHVKFIKMGGWSYPVPKPDSIAEALKMACRPRNDRTYEFFLKAMSPREVVREAKTPSQWEMVMKLFDSSELSECIDILPQKIKKNVLESDLGI